VIGATRAGLAVSIKNERGPLGRSSASSPYRGSRRVFAGIRLKRWNVLARFVDDGRLCMWTNATRFADI
jgi:hypothetical protein